MLAPVAAGFWFGNDVNLKQKIHKNSSVQRVENKTFLLH
jgi:hypothetical protein